MRDGDQKADPFLGTRTFIVPPDIVPVKRRSPLPVKKRTPWHPKPDDERSLDRIGGREWLGGHLALKPPGRYTPVTIVASAIAHASCILGLITVFVTYEELPLVLMERSPILMQIVWLVGASAPPGRSVKPVAPTAPPPAPPPAVAEPLKVAQASPVEEPDSIVPEPAADTAGVPVGSARGVAGGVAGGSPGGVAGGIGSGVSGAGAAPRPLRLGPGIQPPRKIKDVKAVYPAGALTGQLRGTVVIEATIDTDGKVRDAVVLRSVPGLDQAALDAVRQWEFEPAQMNGRPVAVITTVPVSFAIL